jgi:hypothetical protein
MRYKTNVDPLDRPCWVWTRARDANGYGALGRNGKTLSAHRFVYEQLIGPVPDALELDHLCCNPACVNPDHLEPVTHRTNMERRRWNRLDMEAARRIRSEYARGVAMALLALEYGVNRETIRLVIKNETWREAA